MKDTLGFMLAFIIVVSLFQLPIGLMDASFNKCNSKALHIELIFPAYRIGCWLGKRVE